MMSSTLRKQAERPVDNMAIRDFSQEKYDALIEALEDIKSKQQDKFTELGEDFLFNVANHLGIYDPENVVKEKMGNYQKHMMDAYNTTQSDLTKIFDSVQGIDADYGVRFEELAETFSQVRQSIQALNDNISNISDPSALQALKAKLSDINKKMDVADAAVAKSFDKALDYQMTYLKHQAKKGLKESAMSVVGDIFIYCICLTKGDVVGSTNFLWSTLNDYMDLCSNFSASANIWLTEKGVEWLLSEGVDDVQITRFKNREVNRIAEELDKEGISGQIKSWTDNTEDNLWYQAVEGVNSVQEYYDVYDALKRAGIFK